MSLLEASALAIGHGGKMVAEGIDLALQPGTVSCLLGPNGVGKTTLFRTLLGLIPPLSGCITLQGANLAGLSRPEIARRVAYVPQSAAADFAYTALDLVVMGRTAHLGAFATPGPADRAIALAALDSLGIAGLAGRDAARMSGGQRQLVLIARALAQQARLIVMDEPTASLDLANRLLVLERVAALASEGRAVLLSTHDPEQASTVAQQVVALGHAGLFRAGPPSAVLTAPVLSALYGLDLLVETTASGRLVVGSLRPARQEDVQPASIARSDDLRS